MRNLHQSFLRQRAWRLIDSSILSICALIMMLVFSGYNAPALAQDLTAQQRANLCKEKKEGLDQFEKEAQALREEISFEEKSLAELVNKLPDYTPAEIDNLLASAIEKVESLKKRLKEDSLTGEHREAVEFELRYQRLGMDLLTELKIKKDFNEADILNSPTFKRVLSNLEKRKQRQTEVARQIFLLRESIESLNCEQVRGDQTINPNEPIRVDQLKQGEMQKILEEALKKQGQEPKTELPKETGQPKKESCQENKNRIAEIEKQITQIEKEIAEVLGAALKEYNLEESWKTCMYFAQSRSPKVGTDEEWCLKSIEAEQGKKLDFSGAVERRRSELQRKKAELQRELNNRRANLAASGCDKSSSPD